MSAEDTKSTSLPADVTFEYIEIVPLTRDTDGPCTTECDSGDWSAQVKQENLPAVKQEPQDVCYNVLYNTETCDIVIYRYKINYFYLIHIILLNIIIQISVLYYTDI